MNPPGAPSFKTGQKKIDSPRQIAEFPALAGAYRAVAEQREWLNRVHIEVTEISAPTFQEAARAEYMAARFRELGLREVRSDAAGNVLGLRPGLGDRYLILTAHMDTVVPPGVRIAVKRDQGRLYAPGISDNGAGLAALLGTAAALQESGIATGLNLLFVANTGEEGEGNLYGMRELFAQQDIRQRAATVLVLDGAGVRHIAAAGLGSRRFRVEILGPGGHSWSDFGRVNPIHALAVAIARLRKFPLPVDPPTSLNIGTVWGGTTVNSIPQSAAMKVDIRSAAEEELERLSLVLEATVKEAVAEEEGQARGSLEAKIIPLGERPAAKFPSSSRLLAVIQEADQLLGIHSRLECSSTDANIPLSLGIEAAAIGGGGCGGSAHTPEEWYDPQGRDLGLKRILLTVLAMAEIVAES